MNAPTIIIGLILLVLIIFAIRRVIKKGACSCGGDKACACGSSCSSAKKMAEKLDSLDDPKA